MGYLVLDQFQGDYLILYREDKDGKPILNPNDILIVKFFRIESGRVRVLFDGDNYKIVRYRVFKKIDGELRKVVDEKIKSLEGKIRAQQNKKQERGER